MIPPEIFDQIQGELRQLELEEQITMLWVCESGSRAWGFASEDSDYDVRFIYLRRTEDYLRASPLRDVIEKPISGELDISGWDLTKALGLFRKSNPPLLEWLQSPIVYTEYPGFRQALSALIPDFYSERDSMYHYMSMAERGRRQHLTKDTIKLKKYFYMLRPVLACMWIDQGYGPPPIEFHRLLDRVLPDGAIREAIDDLLKRKIVSSELDKGPQIPVLSNFIIDQMEVFTAATKETQFTKAWEPLDDLFRAVIQLVDKQLT
jgi:predicted nucleotidyltransferase